MAVGTPVNFVAKAVSSTQIDLTWIAPTGPVSYYRLERGDGVAVKINAPATGYSNTGLTPSKKYTFRLWAFDSKGNASAPTPWMGATTLASDTPPPEPVPPDPVPPTDYVGMFLGASFQGLTLAAPRAAGSNNWWQDVTGTDTKYGNKLPRAPTALWGGTAGQTDSIQLIETSLSDTPTAIVTDSTVPAGVSNRALQHTLSAAYNGSIYSQNQYLNFPSGSAAQGMVYTSRWCWLQGDAVSRGQWGFLMLTESKTPGSVTERYQLSVLMQTYTTFGATTPVFEIRHDQTTSPNFAMYMQTFLSPTGLNPDTNYGIGQTNKAPVPLGRWFRVELAYNRSDAQGNGWMWFALTDPGSTDAALKAGVQVFAKKGAFTRTDGATGAKQTLGMNMAQPNAKIDRMFMAACYSDIKRSPSSTFQIRYTDIEIWTKWPASATAHPADYL